MQPVDDREQAARARARRQRAVQVQRRRLVLLAFVLVIVVVIVILAVRSCGDGDGAVSSTTESPAAGLVSYSAELTGADSVPAVDTQAAATLTLEYDAVAKEIAFTLEVTSQISSPEVASICQGLPGEYGSTVYTLYGGPAKQGDFEGLLAEGTIVAEDLIGSLEGSGTVADLIALIEEGEIYVSIGNQRHPVDAIRGPVK